ncbi:MAG: dihydroorotase [Alphaproteobacteria bacterium]|nr:dihydroorotase [Alphaproteobacteria bacterium]
MTRLAIVNARLVDPASGRDSPGSLIVEDRAIAALDAPPPDGAEVIDARGAVLAPGLVDAMAFRTDKAACLAGGITRLLLMPDQSPPLDDPALVERAERLGKPDVWVHPLAAATVGLNGSEIAEIGLMKAAGAAGVATGRRAIADSGVMYRLLQYAAGFELPVVTHCEDVSLTKGAVATEGEYATRWGLSAAPAFAEALAIARDLRLAEATGARLHIAQVTTAEGVALVRAAKARGVAVTCGVTPPHMLLNESAVGGYRTFARLSPPLRAESDRQAVLDALADGTIDVIASGHDPRAQDAKRLPFADAEPGAAGAATLLALALSLVRDGRLPLLDVVAMLTTAPARVFGLPTPSLAVGAPADLVLFDPNAPWRIDSDRLPGRAGNTPFDGLPVEGRVLLTVKGGEAMRP